MKLFDLMRYLKNLGVVTSKVDEVTGGNRILDADGSILVTRGLGVAEYAALSDKAIALALRLRSTVAAPPVVETVPTSLSSGNNYYIDGISGVNTNSGNTPATPWKDAWKLPSVPGAGATINVAADAIYEYADTWAAYTSADLFSANNIGQWTGTPAAPIVVRPYYPRGSTSLMPKISWHALMQASDWTQEAGISGGKVWSAAWAKSGNSYYNTAVAFGSGRKMGLAYLQQNTSGAPASLNGENQYAVSATKVYVYVPDGSNPNNYYGEVRIFGGNGKALYRGYNGLSQNVIFLGVKFELCAPFELWSSNTTNNADSLEIAFSGFAKCLPARFKHAQNYASGGTESVLYFHDNYIEDSHSATFKLDSTGGHALNTVAWRVARNRILRGNVSSCYGGAILYNQATGGTYHHAWANYGFGVNNGIAGEQIDGAMLYSDVGSSKSVFFGNVAEQSGKLMQANSALGHLSVANLAIDCGSIGSVSNTTGDLKTPSAIAVHNAYLWTGRIASSSLPVGPNIGGTGIGSWDYEPCLNFTNSQANTTGNAAYNFSSLVVANNLFVNASNVKLANKPAIRYPVSWVTSLLVAGNAPCGLADIAIADANAFATQLTFNAGFCSLIGSVSDAPYWLSAGSLGMAVPAAGSPLVGAGAALSVQYQDAGGRNFAPRPTVGCYEVNV